MIPSDPGDRTGSRHCPAGAWTRPTGGRRPPLRSVRRWSSTAAVAKPCTGVTSAQDGAAVVRPDVQVRLCRKGGELGREYGVENVSAFLCHAARGMVAGRMNQVQAGQRRHEAPSRYGLKGAGSYSSASDLSRRPVPHLCRGAGAVGPLDDDMADQTTGIAPSTTLQHGEAELGAGGPPLALIIDPAAGVCFAVKSGGQPSAQSRITMGSQEGQHIPRSPRAQP
jgi:hypothetical protein